MKRCLDRLGRSPNFCAIKESSGDINRLHMLARDYPHIALSCGMDDQALEFFAWGARSWVCAGSNFAPEAHLALYRACAVEGDFTKGRAIMSAMLPLMRVLEQGGKFVQCIKHGLTLRGIDAGPPRKPLQPLNKDDKRELEEVIRTMNTTIAAITGGSDMTELLTRAEYQAIAADLNFPRAPFIDGKFRKGSGGMMATLNPATGETICEIAVCNADDVDFAVGKAREAFDQGRWRTKHPSEREGCADPAVQADLTRNRRELAVMESLESGKPIRDCETIDLPETIHTIKWHAEAIDKIYDQIVADW